ncbi:rhodanese-like domain-containing protein [Solimonas marina]|uniref:Sulfurtransferase n=1 Tax=Solimonas marina TaxID=2714601 RepID=A0A970B3N7_9GAMM|nr:rhodanese-like domain-containing protein [Solimonas marina]NKF21457.1 sulfurtransferase [Solimonas marina]
MKILTVEQLQSLRLAGAITVVDVREADEVAYAPLDGAVHIALQTLPQRLSELDRHAPLAMLCHHGMRSEMAARFLEQNGYTDVANIVGGIDAWSAVIDPGVPRY